MKGGGIRVLRWAVANRLVSFLEMALAKEYVNIVQELPVKFQVFSDLHSAEEWIIKNRSNARDLHGVYFEVCSV